MDLVSRFDPDRSAASTLCRPFLARSIESKGCCFWERAPTRARATSRLMVGSAAHGPDRPTLVETSVRQLGLTQRRHSRIRPRYQERDPRGRIVVTYRSDAVSDGWFNLVFRGL